MTPKGASLRCIYLSLGLLLTIEALNLSSFSGQAENRLLMESVAGLETTPQAREMLLKANEGPPDYTCTATNPCDLGCCGPLDDTGTGACGFGPVFCGPKCTSDCNRKSECDGDNWGSQYANLTTCPLNVCCSEHGFCGTTVDFCGPNPVPHPQCDLSQRTADARTIGYYEGWNYQRPCGNMEPEDIPLGHWTHINFAFALINPKTFHIEDMDPGTGSRYDRVAALKERQPDLKVWIAVGGWAMNDPGPYRTTFSDMAASEANQDKFFDSLLTFMKRYNLDGVDLDWEYPVAEDRGGIPADFDNYVNLLTRLRERLNSSGRQYGISLTLPASYWYLRGFDLQGMEPYLDWFNVMTYDIHGVWDASIDSLGPIAQAHTNLTEIKMGLELLWRNNINPARVVLGLGFYGRSFTMKDPGCMKAGCEFSEGANGGACTGTAGVLSTAEINEIIANGATVTYDNEAAVKIVTWDSNQWVSFDDTQTLGTKIDFAHQHCLGGTMVWAIDLDDGTLTKALGANIERPELPTYKPRQYFECGEPPRDEL
ncbi:glycoside hydrolase family 18 protein [Dothidotthia symphoricarpi CBS 119687]|uniref:chitinase n=1 Tax=Dothidotthia symphoricarpi CBS 119687 TaxID=1392245 RepID=A0A6A5ZZA5_9PLEO|nr:glycoside hydrolase family 18 protein [Dothidotthia symphoricarpi CBS 119687]KAF2124900.1 glycoside hydrolase family 18 protein [Dothidotthia symphoricarpi CBS 119687]